jgi:hypothetical protein
MPFLELFSNLNLIKYYESYGSCSGLGWEHLNKHLWPLSPQPWKIFLLNVYWMSLCKTRELAWQYNKLSIWTLKTCSDAQWRVRWSANGLMLGSRYPCGGGTDGLQSLQFKRHSCAVRLYNHHKPSTGCAWHSMGRLRNRYQSPVDLNWSRCFSATCAEPLSGKQPCMRFSVPLLVRFETLDQYYVMNGKWCSIPRDYAIRGVTEPKNQDRVGCANAYTGHQSIWLYTLPWVAQSLKSTLYIMILLCFFVAGLRCTETRYLLTIKLTELKKP